MKKNNVQKTQAKSNKKGGQARKRRNNNSNVGRSPGGAQPLATVSTAMSRSTVTRKPNIRSQPNGDCKIHHREYIKDITANSGTPSAFLVESLAINPGIGSTFPWLSQVAQRFERYKFDKLHFIYETEAPSTLGGSLVLAIDYDSSDPAPISKQQALAYKNSVRSAPWNECKHSSAREDLSQQKQYYVRPGAVPANADVKLYDTGNLFVISQGVTTASAVLGELYVEYDVVLHTPALQGYPLVGGSFTAGGTQSNAAPLGSTPTADAQNIGIALDSNSILSFSDMGDYLVTYYLGGVGLTAITAALGPGLTALPNAGFILNAAGSLGLLFTTVRVNNLIGATIDFGAIATSYSAGYLAIGEAPDLALS
jgi:hypothetical protein